MSAPEQPLSGTVATGPSVAQALFFSPRRVVTRFAVCITLWFVLMLLLATFAIKKTAIHTELIARSAHLGDVMHTIVASHLTPAHPIAPPPDLNIFMGRIGTFIPDGMTREQILPIPDYRLGNDWPISISLRFNGGGLAEDQIGILNRHISAQDYFMEMGREVARMNHSVIVQARIDQDRYLIFDAPGLWRPRLPLNAIYALLLSAGSIATLMLFLLLKKEALVYRRLMVDLETAQRTLQLIEPYGPEEIRRMIAAVNAIIQSSSETDAERVRMLAAISHDLRTPFTKIRLHAEYVEDRETREAMFSALAESDALLEESIRFLRREDRKEATALTDIVSLVDAVCEDAAEVDDAVVFHDPELGTGQGKVSGSSLVSAGSPQQPRVARFWVRVRPYALRRAVMNLVSNAVRYGGRADVYVRLQDEQLVIEVRDKGPGIPADKYEKVVLPFYRLEESRNRESGGKGLGLAVVKSVVDAHHGRLEFKALDNGGFSVSIILPVIED